MAATSSTIAISFAPCPAAAKLAKSMRDLAAAVGAQSHLVVEQLGSNAEAALAVIASNWPYDGLLAHARDFVVEARQAGHIAFPGGHSAIAECGAAGAPMAGCAFIGHSLPVGERLFLAFYGGEAGALRLAMAGRVHMRALYALAAYAEATAGKPARTEISQRERECLQWVAEGKTTEEVALILGVSANTINSYMAHAIQKVSATNRAMAVANAIRSGII